MAYSVTCPRCAKEFKVKDEAGHKKVMEDHEQICPDEFFDALKRKHGQV